MSKSKINGVTQTSSLSAAPISSVDQYFNGNRPSDRFDDPQRLGYLKRENLIRESQKLGIITASEVVLEPKAWVYPDWLPQDELSLLVGTPDSGKTTLKCALAAGVTRGNTYSLASDLKPARSGHVIIVNREDDIVTGLVPRLQAAGADLSKVHFVGCKGSKDDDTSFSFANAQDLARLEGLAMQLENNVGLIIVDPVYFAVDGDHNNNHKARQAYEGLAMLAKRLRCAILGIAHAVRNPHNKSPLARVAGPPALREVPRAIMLLWKIASGPTATGGTHVLVHAKNNVGKSDGGFELCIKSTEIFSQNGQVEATKFVVTNQLTGSADDILNEADSGKTSKRLLKTQAAENLLLDVLAKGPRLKSELVKLAEEIDVSEATLILAKDALNIVTKKRKGDGRSVWRLPDSAAGSSSLDHSTGSE